MVKAEGQVDHVIPRRLLPPKLPDVLENLALLCNGCHGIKTGVIEPALYRANVLDFELFLALLARSGPVPSPAMLMEGYGRCAELIRTGGDHAGRTTPHI